MLNRSPLSRMYMEPNMDAQQFCYWLQGYFEISGSDKLTKEQIQIIRDHLQLVFKKETPNYTYPNFWEGYDFSKYEPLKYTDIQVTC